jgi:molecular chaperone GrpE
MAFADEEPGRRRKRSRAAAPEEPEGWLRKDSPLSWAMLPPEEGEAQEEEAEAPAPKAPTAAAPDEWKTRYQYLMADFENFRRRVAKESETAVAGARGKLLLKVIGLHEGIEGALKTTPSDAGSMKEGLALVLRNFQSFLRDEGVEPVAKVGERFQPELHEAVGQQPPSAATPEGTVAVVVQQGYRGPGGLLRPAKVLVATGKPPSSDKGR